MTPPPSSSLLHASDVLVTVAGPDTPGITAALTGLIHANGAELLDIEQVVVRGQLTLCLLIGVDAEKQQGQPVLKDLLFAAKDMGLELDFQVVTRSQDERARDVVHYAVTAIGDAIDAGAVHHISAVLAEHGANIEHIRRLSDAGLKSFEVVIALSADERRAHALRQALVTCVADRGIDVALQRETLTRRSKRLVVMDMDSTLIQMEVIDELARMHGVVERVADITRRAMAGELDFDGSLTERVGLLKGLEWERVRKLAEDLPLTDGAELLIRVLKGLGFKTAVISGGFTFATEAVKQRLGLDYAYANELVVKDGKLTGEVRHPIVGPQRKADLLETIAQQEGIRLDQTIAIGDGANDSAMIERAGLGIAFHAKQKLREAADTSLNAGGLDRILYLLGLRSRDVQEFLER